MVTSFRAKDVSVPDLSVLTTIRYLTKPNRINAQWSSYRLKLVGESPAIVRLKPFCCPWTLQHTTDGRREQPSAC